MEGDECSQVLCAGHIGGFVPLAAVKMFLKGYLDYVCTIL